MKKDLIALTIITLFIHSALFSITYTASPSNYTSLLTSLVPGDTLYFTAGVYTNRLKLINLSGAAGQEIVFTGTSQSSVVFQGNACCNTVSLTQCAYLKIMNITIDGQNIPDIDGIKAEGTAGNWTHHITIENVRIIGHGGDQQTVGISTKCASWNWVIRKNKIEGAGTGMYLGNSNGDAPFVNGLIKNNLVVNTVGYNIEIKHQFNGVRDAFPGTAVDGKTVVRHNVFSKENNASTGADARPNLLVGGFPLTGWGSVDYYEIYGNFFYQNPVEALFQGTGKIMLYDNIFVNHFDPSGSRVIYITPQNGVPPQDIKIFHNTVWAANSSGGIRLYNPDPAYHQYCYGNAVFAPQPITNFADALDNVTDTYANASNYVLSATANLNILNLYPKNGQLTGPATPDSLFKANADWNQDFNGDNYVWTYRGAYSGCCTNNGWPLQLDTIPTFGGTVTSIFEQGKEVREVKVYPNPVGQSFRISGIDMPADFQIFNLLGECVSIGRTIDHEINTERLGSGIYLLILNDSHNTFLIKITRMAIK
jgi:hypothetical protein